MESIETKIYRKIKRADRGRLFFVDMFLKFGNAKFVNKALDRLVQHGKLYRVAMGIYVLPVVSEYIGNVFPDIDTIAVAIAKRDKARILPAGSYAMYKLGITTQVPMNVVYYTDASARKIKIDNRTITLKKASSKNLAAIGEISKLVIQALRTIGKGNVTNDEIKHIQQILQNENPKHLQHDLLIAPVWIRTLLSTNKTIENE
jgi:hypothetical protein